VEFSLKKGKHGIARTPCSSPATRLIVYAESFRQGSFKLQSRHVGCPALISDCSPSSCGQRNRLTQSTTPSSLVLVLALVFELHMQAGRQQWRFVSVSVAFLSYFPLSLSLVHHNMVNKISCVMYVSVLAHWSLLYSNRNRGRRRILQSHATCPSTSPCLVVCFCDAFLLHNRADPFVLELIRLFCSLLLLLDCIHTPTWTGQNISKIRYSISRCMLHF
jgi:hypothetical protein